MTLDDIAHVLGEEPDELRGWQHLGLLPEGPDVPLADSLERVRLIRFAVQRGYSPERLAAIASVHGDMIGPFVESFGRQRGEPVRWNVHEVAAEEGIDADLFARLMGAAGQQDQRVAYREDVEAIRLMKTALDGGVPPEVLTQMLRVYADATNKIADGVSRLFHLYVHEQMRTTGSGGAELLHLTNAISRPLFDLTDPTLLYFIHKAWEQALAEDMMMHLAEETTAPSEVPGEFVRAFLFVDLSSFTPLTEAMGDAAAARVIERFSELVREGAAACSGQVVKQIGDEFMLVFPDGRSAVNCGVSIQAAAAAEPRFPALRIGANVGSVLFREADYVGATVNVAARVASTATRNQFLVTKAVRKELGDLDVEVVPIGTRSLKGVSEEVELFEVRGREAQRARIADPVCGMELEEATSEAELSWEGRRLLFCSEGCLRRFLDNPERYAPA